jgi:2-polyprenyl-3-methyl-5-hydroxy-6-metoxy-1,4-benzoquinol methylase
MNEIFFNPSLNCESIMYALWHKMGMAEKTMELCYKQAMNSDMIERDINFMAQHFPVNSGSILDLGCGWGGVAKIISERGASVTAIDHVFEHAQGTKARCPDANVFQGDVCDLSDFYSESFDVVISRGVIEHIDPNGWRGICLDYTKKQAHLNEMVRVMKHGGHGFISTGNYMFPFCGETNKWFFHWMPQKEQAEWLEKSGESADTYTMITWSRMARMIEAAGLKIITVHCHDVERWRPNIEQMVDKSGVDIIMKLIGENPNYMSSWQIIVEKS